MIKAVIFDCFGVLTTDKWKEFVGELDEDAKYAIHQINAKRGAGELTRDEFVNELASATGLSKKEVDEASRPGGLKNFEIIEYIRHLKNENYKIGLLSNIGSNWVREEFLAHEEQELFNDIVLSFEVGMTKPDPRIFNVSCTRLAVVPQDAVLVDDIEAYCESAQSVGMQAITYQNFAQMKRELEKILSSG